jgi:hypothetical protein
MDSMTDSMQRNKERSTDRQKDRDSTTYRENKTKRDRQGQKGQ